MPRAASEFQSRIRAPMLTNLAPLPIDRRFPPTGVPGPVASPPGISRYVALFAAAVVLALTWKVYPLFKDTLRSDGRVLSLDDYVAEACGERVGPLATSCREATLEHGRRLVAGQQAKALLIVEAPLIAYLVIYLPYRAILRRLDRDRARPAARPTA